MQYDKTITLGNLINNWFSLQIRNASLYCIFFNVFISMLKSLPSGLLASISCLRYSVMSSGLIGVVFPWSCNDYRYNLKAKPFSIICMDAVMTDALIWRNKWDFVVKINTMKKFIYLFFSSMTQCKNR